jgi:hypothetical protein
MVNSVNSHLFNALYEKYLAFDDLSHNVASQVIGTRFSSMHSILKNMAATIVKVVAVVIVALAFINIITNPFLIIGSLCVGAILSPKQQRTQESIESWFKSGYSSVIDSVFDNEDTFQRVALSAAAVFTATFVVRTIFVPIAFGLFAGYHLSKEAFKSPPESEDQRSASSRKR